MKEHFTNKLLGIDYSGMCAYRKCNFGIRVVLMLGFFGSLLKPPSKMKYWIISYQNRTSQSKKCSIKHFLTDSFKCLELSAFDGCQMHLEKNYQKIFDIWGKVPMNFETSPIENNFCWIFAFFWWCRRQRIFVLNIDSKKVKLCNIPCKGGTFKL